MTIELLERFNAEEQISDMQLAMTVGAYLEELYPNHVWIVSCHNGGIVIRHKLIADEVARVIGRQGFAACLPPDKLNPKQLRHTVMQFGGLFLEAFGLKRGAWDGEMPVVPPGWRFKQDRNFQ